MKTRHSEIVVGVDGGGSSTRAVVLDAHGACLGYAVAGSGNRTAVGADHAALAITEAVVRALDTAGVPRDAPRTLAVALAGASGADATWLSRPLAEAGVGGTVVIEADLVAGYLSGTLAEVGYAVVAGTGAIAAQVRDRRIAAVADGLGWLLGDDGSGFQLGLAGARAAAAQLDGRGPATAITPGILAELDVPVPPEPDDRDGHRRPRLLASLLDRVYAERPVALARCARVVSDAATAGDPVAREIVTSAAAGLARSLVAVLDVEHPGPIVLGGSVLAHQPIVADALRAALPEGAEFVSVPDGAVGSGVLALAHAGLPVDTEVWGRIHSTLAALR
ncbi:N-acetylglucosamine kinase [Schumannella sp. 10F1B-5-1]|uniref:N-acetylglucosamine kinase n=1 Tax=Schumannella sp. 10F1B-5-1 TaxID=2590780 RepID=UPI0015E83782|nr:BadF/BadG/BcrA/BcrD ATPase family protein [Schumannella sp. 10F1B-5-1]